MRRRCFTPLLPLCTLLLAVLLGGCSLLDNLKLPFGKDQDASSSQSQEEVLPEEDPEYPVSAAGADLKVRPGKIISLAPSLTEKLYDLKAEDQLVGVSDYCDYPAQTQTLPRCGTALMPNLEQIKELQPHLVLTEAPLSEADTIALQQMNVEIAVLPHAESLDALYSSYHILSVLLNGQTTGGALGEAFTDYFQEQLELISDATAPFAQEKSVPVLYLRLLDFTVATGDTLEHQLLQAAGLTNIAAEYTQWSYPAPSAQSESGRADFMAVKAIFCDQRDVTIKMLEQSSFYKGLPAVLQDWYLYIDATTFERQSLRMLDTLREMAKYCYPDGDFSVPVHGVELADKSGDDNSDSQEASP